MRRHSGVVCVKQLVHVVGPVCSPAAFCRLDDDPFLDEGGGDDGRLCATEDMPEAVSLGGEFGVDRALRSAWLSLVRPARLAFGVEAVRGTFWRRSAPLFCCLKDCDLPRLPASQSPLAST